MSFSIYKVVHVACQLHSWFAYFQSSPLSTQRWREAMTGITFALTRYASDWLKQISYAVQPIRGTTQI